MKHRFTSKIRRPVKRQGAEQYLLVTLMSFAVSVTLTRLFLVLTGYPQLGGGTFHIAHVLWGGLLLYIAALLPLIFANRWVFTLGAALGGAGVGLFIDEVGKFITSENNYFYPLAAPIIYAFFLLTVLVYSRIRRLILVEPRIELYRSLDAMEEVLEHDLDPQERDELMQRLQYVARTSQRPDLARLANELMEFLISDTLSLAERRSTAVERLLWFLRQFEGRWINRLRLKTLITSALLALGMLALARMAEALPVGTESGSFQRLLPRFLEEGLISDPSGFIWFLARLALEAVVGALMIVSAGLLVLRQEKPGTSLGYWSLLLSLTTVDLLIFYFDQFSTILIALLQFSTLLLVSYYRKRYVKPLEKERLTVEGSS